MKSEKTTAHQKNRDTYAEKMRIGEKLRQLRGDKTREEVASCVGISVSAMTMYENNKRVPRDEIKLRLSKYFGKTVQEIFFS